MSVQRNKFPFHLLQKMRTKLYHDKTNHGLKMKCSTREDCKLPQEFITRKVIPSGLIFLKTGSCEVLFYYEPNRKKKQNSVSA